MTYPPQPIAPTQPQPPQYAPPTPPVAQPEPQQFTPPQGPSWQAYPAPPTPPAAQPPSPAPAPYQPVPFGPAQYAPPMADSYQQPPAPVAPPAQPAYQPNTAPPQYAPAPAGYTAVQPGPAPAPAPAPAAPQPQAAYQYSPQQVQELEQFYAQRQPQPPAPATPAAPEPKKPWASLDYDEELEQHGRWDADAGMYVPKGQYSSMQAVQRLNEIHAERQKRIMRLTTADPVEIWREAGGVDAAREAAAEVFNERFSQLQRQQIESSFIEQNADKLYARGPNGDIQRYQDGTPVLSDWGSQVVTTLSELESSGVADMRAQLQWLNRLVPPPQPEPQPPQQPAQAAWNPYPRGPNGNGNGNGNGHAPSLFAPQQPAPQPLPYSPQQLAAYGQQAFGPPVQPTLAQQAAPPQYQQPSQQQLFLQRAEVAHAQQPGTYLPGTGGTLGYDPANPYAAPQQPFNPEGGYLLKSAIAQGLIPDPRNNF